MQLCLGVGFKGLKMQLFTGNPKAFSEFNDILNNVA